MTIVFVFVSFKGAHPRPGDSCVCVHCNQRYIYGLDGRASTANQNEGVPENVRDVISFCRERVDGVHEPNIILKDNDLKERIRLNEEDRRDVMRQLQNDTKFLAGNGIMDYSLLLGIANMKYHVDHASSPREVVEHSIWRSSVSPVGAGNPSFAPSNGVHVVRSNARMKPAKTIVGPGMYFMGLIDVLQTWDLNKRLERLFKTNILRLDPDGISALGPFRYQERFMEKMTEIFGSESD